MKRNLTAIQATYGADVGEEFADITNGMLLNRLSCSLNFRFRIYWC